MTKPLDLHDRIDRINHELAEINKAMTPELTPQERLALLKLENTATTAAIAALEREQIEQKWAGKRVRDLSQSEKIRMVSDLGAKAFEERVWAELDAAPGRT